MKIQSLDYLLIALETGSAILIQYRYYNTVQAVTTQDLSADIANSSPLWLDVRRGNFQFFLDEEFPLGDVWMKHWV